MLTSIIGSAEDFFFEHFTRICFVGVNLVGKMQECERIQTNLKSKIFMHFHFGRTIDRLVNQDSLFETDLCARIACSSTCSSTCNSQFGSCRSREPNGSLFSFASTSGSRETPAIRLLRTAKFVARNHKFIILSKINFSAGVVFFNLRSL